MQSTVFFVFNAQCNQSIRRAARILNLGTQKGQPKGQWKGAGADNGTKKIQNKNASLTMAPFVAASNK